MGVMYESFGYEKHVWILCCPDTSELHLSQHLWCRWVSEEYRARALTVIHASFSLGMVFGMLATPVLVVHFAWPGALMGFTLLGLAWAVSCPISAHVWFPVYWCYIVTW